MHQDDGKLDTVEPLVFFKDGQPPKMKRWASMRKIFGTN